ncbi:conserved hypothetical protein [uncultured Defluviicoccus sp.]|uniref:Uncharacterized protein n=1 Tax=metagenome TaxID=256318 RepID=A0A380TGL8_9ZZZZ|nr:conserved hypothetical protein [uncultured Defluviicoccus sp.]
MGIEDLEEPSDLCCMCESAEIRFVHYMQHPNYPDILGVGCVCAEYMEGDYVAPKEREKPLRLLARQRRSWLGRRWRVSAKGNLYLNVEGFNLTIFPTSDGQGAFWSFKVQNRVTGQHQLSRRRYPTQEAAKRATFVGLQWAKNHLR